MTKANLLTAKGVEKIVRGKRYGWHHDGGGLFLVGSETYGTFSWVARLYRGTITGKPRDYGIGAYRDFTLEQARKEARDARLKAAAGIDPIYERQRRLEEAKATAAARELFADTASDFLRLYSPTWKNEKHRAQWESTLRQYAFPKLGKRPISDIDQALINDTLAPIWQTIPETASRVKQRIERVIQWAKDGRPLPHKGTVKRAKSAGVHG